MDPNGVRIISIYLICVAELIIWLLVCLAVTAIVAVVQLTNKKIRQLNPVRRTIKFAAYATIGFITLVLLEIVYFTMYWFLRFSVWLLICLIVTVIMAAVQLINKKIRKKKPIHWAIKLAGYVAFYTITLFVVYKILEPYPSNWFATYKEYRELAYELYNLELDCYEYDVIYEGSHGEIVISFEANQNWERRDDIAIKTVVEEYIKENGYFQGKRMDIRFCCGSTPTHNHLYNFNPWTGEMGDDIPYWFVTDAHVNSCTELAEFYHDFSGICGSVRSMDGLQDLTSICNLTYFQLYVGGGAKEDVNLEEQYLEEINTLLPDCEIHLNQYNIEIRPAWEKFSD